MGLFIRSFRRLRLHTLAPSCSYSFIRQSTMHSSTKAQELPSDPELFFRNTSRRWVSNEDTRLREQYVRFNISELQRVAAEAMNKSRCTRIIKLAEGGFNKIFLLTMDDESEVIARIPTSIAGPRYYTTASEAATMQFLRDILQIPVPRVLAYSATHDNPVGVEYIIMERLQGQSLGSRWLSLSTAELADVMSQLVEFEQKIFSFKFPAYGSLYNKHDISENLRRNISSVEGDFCIGPICKRQFWHRERADMNIDRGPWDKPEDCVTAPARRELAWTSAFAKPRPRRAFLLPTDEDIDPNEHKSLLSQYLLMAPSLVPSKQEMSTPILRHPDLSFANILLTPGSNKIQAIIDWQDTAILPLFMQAGYPTFCEHDLSKPQSLEQPKLPDDYDKMEKMEKLQAQIKFQLGNANLFYTVATGAENDLNLLALRQPGLGMIQYLISQAGYPWDGDLINLKAAIIGVSKIWELISSNPCPVSFSPAEKEEALHEANEWRECADILSTVRDSLGVDEEGGTDPDNFEHACMMNQRWRLEMLQHAEDHQRKLCWQGWAFKDDDDNSLPPVL